MPDLAHRPLPPQPYWPHVPRACLAAAAAALAERRRIEEVMVNLHSGVEMGRQRSRRTSNINVH